MVTGRRIARASAGGRDAFGLLTGLVVSIVRPIYEICQQVSTYPASTASVFQRVCGGKLPYTEFSRDDIFPPTHLQIVWGQPLFNPFFRARHRT
jgi:hypothetical protein